jgi:hypothetical protein
LFRSSPQYHFSPFSVLLACLCLSARDFSTSLPVLHWSRDLSFVSALVCLLVSSVDSLLSTRQAGDRFYLLFVGPREGGVEAVAEFGILESDDEMPAASASRSKRRRDRDE